MKHFNAGNVWGQVKNAVLKVTPKGTPFMRLEIGCENARFGDVRIFGKLWGKKKIDGLKERLNEDPEAAFRFRGFFTQYEKEDGGIRYSNYNFINWMDGDGAESRAAFILVGEVTSLDRQGDEGVLGLSVIREQKGREDLEEFFEIFTPDASMIEGLVTGDVVEVRGLVRRREEDFYGGAGGAIKPYAGQLKKRG